VSRSNGPAGFVPMQGARKRRGWRVDLAGVRLWSDEPAGEDRAALAGVLATERCEAWSGVTLPRNRLINGPDLWLVTDPDLCQLKASREAVEAGVVDAIPELNTPALVSGGSLAYRARLRPVDDEGTAFEFGAYGHGPRGAELAERLAGHIRTWDRDHRHGPGPVLAVHPASTPATSLPAGSVLTRRHSTVVLSWPGVAR
jgi:protein-L-isoaspartate(D-aspartate) O-methyltransferase